MAIEKLQTDYVTETIAGTVQKRKYKIINNSDGTISLEDVTNYVQKGSDFDADDINKINGTINKIIDAVETVEESGAGSGGDGYSPTATVTKSGNTATISITDKNGTTSATITDGKDGKDGNTPTIGENGNWFIADIDTQQPSRGESGSAATIKIGTVTTGEPETEASVTNSGTPNAAILNFVIPRGERGNPGSSESGSSSSGQYAFELRADGHLWIVTEDEEKTDSFYINDAGHLMYIVEG